MGTNLLTPNQRNLDLTIAKEQEVDGVGMGVFGNGTTYLTGRGLARLCGVDQKAIVQVTQALASNVVRPREAKIAALLEKQGIDPAQPYIEVQTDKERYNAFPAGACMAFLEYYAFEAGPNTKETAVESYRRLAGKGLQQFIYEAVGYDPSQEIDHIWAQYRDRVSNTAGTVPIGFFIVFREIADLFVALISRGSKVGASFVPDISVGVTWAKYWKDNKLEAKFGAPSSALHYYPDYFPQAASNPQTINAYPEEAIPAFRRWAREIYLPEKLPPYLSRSVKKGLLTIDNATEVSTALLPKK